MRNGLKTTREDTTELVIFNIPEDMCNNEAFLSSLKSRKKLNEMQNQSIKRVNYRSVKGRSAR